MAGLNGDVVETLAGYVPNGGPGYVLFFNTSTIAAGLTLTPADYTVNIPPPNKFDIFPSFIFNTDTVHVSYPITMAGTHFSSGAFNGLDFAINPADPPLHGAVLLGTNIPGLTQQNVSFNDHNVWVNVENLTLPGSTVGRGYIDVGFDFGPPYREYSGPGAPEFWPATPGTVTVFHVLDNLPQPDLKFLQIAEAVWSSEANIEFVNSTTPTGHDQITIGLTNFGQTGQWGNTAFIGIPATGQLGQANITIQNPAQAPGIPEPDGNYFYGRGPISLLETIEHELGHAIGLGHNLGDPNSVMAPGWINRGQFTPDANDIRLLQSLYGPPVPHPGALIPLS